MRPSALTLPMRAVLEMCWFVSLTSIGPSGVSSARPFAASLISSTAIEHAFSADAAQM